MLLGDYTDVSFNLYTKKSLLRNKAKLLEKTNRVKEYAACLKELGEGTADEIDQKIKESQDRMKQSLIEINTLKQPLQTIYFTETPVPGRRENKIQIAKILDEQETKEGHWITFIDIDGKKQEKLKKDTNYINFHKASKLGDLFRLGRLMYELGQFGYAQVFLSKFIQNYDEFKTSNADAVKEHTANYDQALWGVFACKLLKGEKSFDAFFKLEAHEQAMELKKFSVAAKRRTWLLHWILYQDLINNDNDKQDLNELLKFFSKDTMTQNIILVCPYLLRYFCLANICQSNKLGEKLKKCEEFAVNTLQGERASYTDPLTMFLVYLFVDCNFQKAADCLKECRKLFTFDLFLCSFSTMFFDQARVLFFARYCMVNNEMSIDKVGELLMLGKYAKMEDNDVYSVGGQPVHYEE
eukprot:UN25518